MFFSQRKAAEALRMAEMVKEQQRLESERLKAKVSPMFWHHIVSWERCDMGGSGCLCGE